MSQKINGFISNNVPSIPIHRLRIAISHVLYLLRLPIFGMAHVCFTWEKEAITIATSKYKYPLHIRILPLSLFPCMPL